MKKHCDIFIYELGWVRFKLSHIVTNVGGPSSSSISSSDAIDCNNSDWTTAYYRSRVDKIRVILDHGQPLPTGMRLIFKILNFFCIFFYKKFPRVLEQCEYVNGNQKDDSHPGTLLLLFSTPNFQQSTSSTFVHRNENALYRIETAFEVRVRTQAVCVADTSNDMSEPMTSNGPGSVWTTKEAGACALSALLLKLTPEGSMPQKHTI